MIAIFLYAVNMCIKVIKQINMYKKVVKGKYVFVNLKRRI